MHIDFSVMLKFKMTGKMLTMEYFVSVWWLYKLNFGFGLKYDPAMPQEWI